MMDPYYRDDSVTLHLGDALAVSRQLRIGRLHRHRHLAALLRDRERRARPVRAGGFTGRVRRGRYLVSEQQCEWPSDLRTQDFSETSK